MRLAHGRPFSSLDKQLPCVTGQLGVMLMITGETRQLQGELSATVAIAESDKRLYLRIKRLMDIVLSSILLMLLSPLLLLVTLLIKLDSSGPVIFRQPRIGKDGDPFTMLKFRSMRQDADPLVHQEHMRRLIRGGASGNPGGDKSGDGGEIAGKLPNDARVTMVGKIIRKTSLDELPQFFNILKGEMSLVGPRPSLPYEVEMWKDWHMRRLEVLPGMASLWVVRGRADIPFDDQVRLDIEYIENQSLWLDIKILLQTPWAMLSGRGAG
jgi:lipopolysaccharide/colanic/teichoic acid biosynthesis glycosyltransferase